MKAEEVNHKGTDKVSMYRWRLVDEPGVFLEIDKNDLMIDSAYQREIREEKSLKMAADWSWIACGCIKVADRSGDFFVVDGQHRVMAARKRSDIEHLPCLVFKSEGMVSEAKGFLSSNTTSRALSILDRFKALVITRDAHALFVLELLESSGRVAKKGRTDSVACIATLLNMARLYPEKLKRIWPLVDAICQGKAISQSLVQAIIHIENRMDDGASLTDPRWLARINNLGYEALHDSMLKAAGYYGSRTPKPHAIGLLNAINKGLRNELLVKGVNA